MRPGLETRCRRRASAWAARRRRRQAVPASAPTASARRKWKVEGRGVGAGRCASARGRSILGSEAAANVVLPAGYTCTVQGCDDLRERRRWPVLWPGAAASDALRCEGGGGGGGGRSDREDATTALSGMPPLHQAQLAAFSFAEHPQREGAAATNPTGGGSGATASKRSSGPPLPLVPTGGKVQQKPVNGGKEKEGDGQQVAEQVRSHIH